MGISVVTIIGGVVVAVVLIVVLSKSMGGDE